MLRTKPLRAGAENSVRGFYRNRKNTKKALKTKEKFDVENSVENVDNSLNSCLWRAVYVKQNEEVPDKSDNAKSPKNGPFSTKRKTEMTRMSMQSGVDIPLVIVFEKKIIDYCKKMWYHNPA